MSKKIFYTLAFLISIQNVSVFATDPKLTCEQKLTQCNEFVSSAAGKHLSELEIFDFCGTKGLWCYYGPLKVDHCWSRCIDNFRLLNTSRHSEFISCSAFMDTLKNEQDPIFCTP